MNAAPRHSVITICRNALPALIRTVESVLPQLTPAVEYLVVDGGSTDGTTDYLRTLEPRGVRWVSEPDRGISDAMNKGVRLTRGAWIAHLHADDTYLPGAVAHLLAEIDADNADVLCGWIVKAEPEGDVICRSDPEMMERDMGVNHPATLVRRDWFERLQGFDIALRNAMDYDFFLRAKLAGARFRIVPLAITRFAAGGQSERSLWNTLRETHDIRRRHLRRGWTRSRAYLVALWIKGSIRIALQRAGMTRIVDAYRRRFAWPPKTPLR